MRSPSPDNDPEDQLDSSNAEINPSAPVKSPVRRSATAAMASGRAASSRAGQWQQHVRAEPSKHQSSSNSYNSPGAVSTAPVPVNQLADAAMPAPASMTQASPAQPGVNLDQPVQKWQPAAQDGWEAPAAAQAARHAVRPSLPLEGRHDAAQQTVTAADTATPVKAQELLTDDQSTQTPRAHASPRRLSRAPPGRDPLRPLASQAGLWEGLPPREGAIVSPSGVAFASADMPGAFAPFSPEVQHQRSGWTQDAKQGVNNAMLHAHERQSEQLLHHWQLDSQRQMASQQQQSLLSDQMRRLGQLPQQVQGQVPASEQLLRQLSSQGLSGGPQLPTHQGHDQSDPFPALLLPSSLPARSRTAHTVATAAESLTSQAAVATAVSDTAAAAAPLHEAQKHHDAAVPAQIMSSSVAAAAIAVTQHQQTAGSNAHPDTANFAMPPLPLHGPHLAISEPYYRASSHGTISGSLPNGHGRPSHSYGRPPHSYGRPPHSYGRPPAVPSSSWWADAQEEQKWVPGHGAPAHVTPMHPPIVTSMGQMQRLRDTGETAVPCLCCNCGLLPSGNILGAMLGGCVTFRERA